MKEKPSPAYQWYPKDILSSARVAEMTLAEEGAFRRALDFSWLNGSLPSDAKKLAAIIGKGCTIKIAIVVKGMFTETDGRLTNDRLEACRIAQQMFKQSKSIAGANGANKRWNNDSKHIAQPSQNDSTAIDLPLANGIANDSSSSTSTTTLKEKVEKETFSSTPSAKARKVNHLFREDEFFDKDEFVKKFAGTAYEAFDLNYYHEVVMNWSDSKGAKRLNWIATAKNFMMDDQKKGTAKMKYQRAKSEPSEPYPFKRLADV